MKRLTLWYDGYCGRCEYLKKTCATCPDDCALSEPCEGIQDIVDRLAAYEDTGLEPEEILTGLEMADLFAELRKLDEVKKAEAEGRLLILPCKVGDHVYTAQRGIVSELVVTCIEVYLSQLWIQWEIISGIYGRYRMDGFPAFDIGKTVFLTRAEAEAALRGGADG